MKEHIGNLELYLTEKEYKSVKKDEDDDLFIFKNKLDFKKYFGEECDINIGKTHTTISIFGLWFIIPNDKIRLRN